MGEKSKLTRRQVLSVMAASTMGTLGCSEASKQVSSDDVHGKRSTAMQNPLLGSLPLPASGPWPTLDPFLFCVHHHDDYPKGNQHLGPQAALDGRQLGQDFSNKDGWNMYHGAAVPGFPRHPHRGFETVTVVKRGIIDHADSLGAKARYGDGDVQWLTAGNGINHAEMFPLLDATVRNPIDFFQIWLNLPAARKRVAPHFAMFWSPDVPQKKLVDAQGLAVNATVVAGNYFGVVPPSPPPNSWAHAASHGVSIIRIEMPAGSQWLLPSTLAGVNRAVYVVKGSVRIGDPSYHQRCRLVLKSDLECIFTAGETDAVLLLLEGRPIGEPIVQHGPFVMNTRSEIVEAFSDYRATEFGGWPWPSQEPIHGSQRRRFATHADGRTEAPG